MEWAPFRDILKGFMEARGELLIACSHEPDRKGIQKLFDNEGFMCTCVSTAAQAGDMVSKKFFPVALVDLDLEQHGGGLEALRIIHENSTPTALILLTGRRTYDAVVAALRLGVQDVILKRPGEVEHLRRAVIVALDRGDTGNPHSDLLHDVQRVLNDAFAILLQMGRTQYADVSPGSGTSFRPAVLLVEHDSGMVDELTAHTRERNWRVHAVSNGGSALDKAGTQRFDLILSRADLPDLNGTVVVKTIQAQMTTALGLVYSAFAPEGYVDVYREGDLLSTERPNRNLSDLAHIVDSQVQQISATRRDRKVIQAFRSAHEDFFRRYAQLKLRLSRLLD